MSTSREAALSTSSLAPARFATPGALRTSREPQPQDDPTPGKSRFLGRVEGLFWVVGIFLVGLWIGHELGVRLFQARESARLENRLIHEPAPSEPALAVATRAEVAKTGLVGHIKIQRLGLSALIAEGEDDLTLDRAVGHIPGTALPGEPGNVCLAGHRDSFFRGLKDIRAKDVIELLTPDGKFTYIVESTSVVSPDQVDLLDPTPRSSLTLVTCYPFTYIGNAPKRFIVRAVRLPSEPLVFPDGPLPDLWDGPLSEPARPQYA